MSAFAVTPTTTRTTTAITTAEAAKLEGTMYLFQPGDDLRAALDKLYRDMRGHDGDFANYLCDMANEAERLADKAEKAFQLEDGDWINADEIESALEDLDKRVEGLHTHALFKHFDWCDPEIGVLACDLAQVHELGVWLTTILTEAQHKIEELVEESAANESDAGTFEQEARDADDKIKALERELAQVKADKAATDAAALSLVELDGDAPAIPPLLRTRLHGVRAQLTAFIEVFDEVHGPDPLDDHRKRLAAQEGE